MELLALAVKVLSVGAVLIPALALAIVLGVTWLVRRRKRGG